MNGLAGYTGYQQDPTGLNYARTRYYNPATGRFLSQDPVTSVNPYAYVQGNPTNRTDPTGQLIVGYAGLAARATQDAQGVAQELALLGISARIASVPHSCSIHQTLAGLDALIAGGSLLAIKPQTVGNLIGLGFGVGALGLSLDAMEGTDPATSALWQLSAAASLVSFANSALQVRDAGSRGITIATGLLGTALTLHELIAYSSCSGEG